MPPSEGPISSRIPHARTPRPEGRGVGLLTSCKPSSVPIGHEALRVTIMSLEPSSPMTSSTLPVSPADHGCGPRTARDCLRLHAVGFAVPRPSPAERCALTAPFHPCLRPKPHRRSVLCGTVPDPQSTGRWALPTTVILSCSDFPRGSEDPRDRPLAGPSVAAAGRQGRYHLAR